MDILWGVPVLFLIAIMHMLQQRRRAIVTMFTATCMALVVVLVPLVVLVVLVEVEAVAVNVLMTRRAHLPEVPIGNDEVEVVVAAEEIAPTDLIKVIELESERGR